MSGKNLISAILLLPPLLMISCKKNGTGGHADISANVIHHVKPIPYATIYIKYGAKEFPGANPSNYSSSVKTDVNGHADFTNLRYGDYYLYGVGFDSSIFQTVTGGDHLQIKWSERKKTISFTVPVTE